MEFCAGGVTMVGYSAHVEAHMKWFYHSLRENDRRRYAAVEAEKLGHGGVEYIASLLKCDPKTIHSGQEDLQQQPEQEPGRVRKKGGPQKLS